MNGDFTFRAMGCSIVVAGATDTQRAAIAALFLDRERCFTRFTDDSELARVNAAPGPAVLVSPVFARAARVSLRAAAETDGLVDPTLLRAVESAGYDADIEQIGNDPAPPGRPVPGTWRSIALRGRVLSRPAGVGLDLNGVVKSLTVDDALGLLTGPGYVSAGGDLAARGDLDVALPGDGAVRLRRGALATSGTTTRRWKRAGVSQHHLIDPQAGRPSRSPWEQVTACGATCVAADVAAKAAFLLGESGPAWLDARGIPGRFLLPGGDVVVNASWADAMEPACI